jgi:CBS domain-containing protein
MTVADLMRRHVRTVSVDATIADVVQTLAAARVSALPVVDRLGRAVRVERAGALVGVISQTDLVAALAAGWPADATLV